MSNEDWNELDESYRSALSGALETAHPAVEQAGGDERAAFEAWLAQAMSKKFEPEFDLAKYEDSGEYRYSPAAAYWKAWQARAALAQPSPAQPEGAPVIGCLCGMPMTEGHHSPDGCCNLEEFAPQAQADQAEAERPEVVGYRVSMPDEPELGHWLEEEAESEPQIQHHEPLMSVAQHDASVARWAEMFNRVEQERDAALARVAELEKQEPVAYVLFRDGEVYYETDDNIVISNTPGDETDLYRWLPVFTAPAAQAQQLHDLDKQCRDDVARALGLRPSQERGFAWSYLLASIKSCVKASEDAAQAQHSVPEGWMRVPIEPLLNMMSDKDHDTRITAERQLLSILAAAPGKKGV